MFRKCPVAKKFMDNKVGLGGGVSGFLVDIFMSHTAEFFRERILLLEKSFGFKKFYG